VAAHREFDDSTIFPDNYLPWTSKNFSMHAKTSLLAPLYLLALASPGRAQTTTTIPPTISLSWGEYPASTYTSDTKVCTTPDGKTLHS